MQLSPKEFDDRLHQGKLHLALIGMSGMGKTLRSRQLKEHGFRNIDCDGAIAVALTDLLQTEDANGLGRWMGQPYESGYKEREQEYLAYEARAMEEAFANLAGNTVIDTTGSIVYLSEIIHRQLRNKTLVVHLEANGETRERMFEIYMADPKPVVWGTLFSKKNDEGDGDALMRSYGELLTFRHQRYRELADISLPHNIARHKHLSAAGFLQAIRDRLVR
jgi:shikimate kinase